MILLVFGYHHIITSYKNMKAWKRNVQYDVIKTKRFLG